MSSNEESEINTVASYVMIHFKPLNTTKLNTFFTLASETLIEFKGEFVMKGPAEVLSGQRYFDMLVVIGFPTKKTAIDWFNSSQFEALKPIRDESMESQFQLVGQCQLANFN